MSKVMVLGCGPAGLLVAHAVEQAGHVPVIFSKKQKSHIPGSQYFHEAIPGVTEVYPENTVQYVRMGTEEGYARKVYGDPSRPTGWEAYNNVYPSWNVPKAYDRLWERFEDRIIDVKEITYFQISGWIHVHEFETIISTLPAQAICDAPEAAPHFFDGVPFWIKEMPVPEIDRGRDIVVYNGLPEDHWYRWSILGERHSIETTVDPHQFSWSGDDWLYGQKAVYTNCDCWPTVVRAGRWAQWRHGVLLHHAYRTAVEEMKKLELPSGYSQNPAVD
jgi:hypothetical protein